MTKSTQKYRLHNGWVLSQVDKSLIISGGADAKFEIELETDQPNFFSTLGSARTFSRKELDTNEQKVLEEFLTAEIVVPVLQTGKSLRVGVIGDKNNLSLGSVSQKAADLIIVVRINSTYAELLEKINYPELIKPHLFVDLAYHHTLSVGPLVFPGETACIACLQGRVSTRWGDEAPPSSPRAEAKYSKVANELIKSELDRIKNGDTSLTNKTVSWNFQDRSTKTNQLLKVPLCPICNNNKIDQTGSLALPWSKNESTSNTV